MVVCVVVKLPAVALNVFEADPAGTVTELGTVKIGFVFVRLTTAPPVGAVLVRVTVQVLVALGFRLPGLQDSDEINTDAARLTLVLAELLL